MPVTRIRVCHMPDPPLPLHGESDPPVVLAGPITVVLQLGKWDHSQLKHNRIDDESRARLVELGYKYSMRLQKWWRPVSEPELV